MTPKRKPGFKTTEGWLSLIAVLIGALTANSDFFGNDKLTGLLGLGGSILAALGYTASRTYMKTHELKAETEIMKSMPMGNMGAMGAMGAMGNTYPMAGTSSMGDTSSMDDTTP